MILMIDNKKKTTDYRDFVRNETGKLINIKTMKIVNEMVHTNKNDFNQIMNRVGV